MKLHSKGWLLLAAIAVVAAAAAATGGLAIAGSTDNPAAAKGLGPLTGLLPRDHLTVESALQVDLGKESVRLPLYKGKANGETVWYVLVDASDQGIANDLGIKHKVHVEHTTDAAHRLVHRLELRLRALGTGAIPRGHEAHLERASQPRGLRRVTGDGDAADWLGLAGQPQLVLGARRTDRLSRNSCAERHPAGMVAFPRGKGRAAAVDPARRG